MQTLRQGAIALGRVDHPQQLEPLTGHRAGLLNTTSSLHVLPQQNLGFDLLEKSNYSIDPRVLIDLALSEERDRLDHTDSESERPPHLRLVLPPREVKKPEQIKPKGTLRQPREQFPGDPVTIREGVAPLKVAWKDGMPPDARWTKVSRRMVDPEALEAGKERYEQEKTLLLSYWS
jgi:hypothetical protein